MKHARVTAIAASVAAATVVSGVGASSSGASAGVAALRFYERSGADARSIDNAPKGKKAGRGDVVLYANPVFDRTGTQVGTDHGVCIVLVPGQSQCDSTLALPKGQIVTHGLQGAKSGFDLAVIGGTGAYSGARGTMTMRPIKDGGSTLLISLL